MPVQEIIALSEIRQIFANNKDSFSPWLYNVMIDVIDLCLERNQQEMRESLVWILGETISGRMSNLSMKNSFFAKIQVYDNNNEYRDKIEQAFQNAYVNNPVFQNAYANHIG
jgi:hypothetical protein